MILLNNEDWVYVTNYNMGLPQGEIFTFRPAGYQARTPNCTDEEGEEVSGALEYAGPFFNGQWMSDPDRRPWQTGKLFYTRGDIFEGVFFKDLMREGIMQRLQESGSYKTYKETYDPERDEEEEGMIAKNQVYVTQEPFDEDEE